jgi:hypothetical protein
MPINPGTTTPIFLAALIANGLVGPGTSQLATGLATGLSQYVQAGVIVTSIDIGTLGAGTGIGPSIVLNPNILIPAMTASLAGHGIIGSLMPAQANAISFGISASLALGIVQTINTGVGIGAGKLQLIPNGSGGTLFVAGFKAAGMSGSMANNMGLAVGLALDAVILSALGVVIIVGPPNIVPGAGIGIGKIV